MRHRRWVVGLISIWAGMAGSWGGCAMGPAMLQATRTSYNQVIQRTTSEQLLLNLVRLKYRDQPMFLEVSGVSAQFQFDRSAGIDGTLTENIGVNDTNPGLLKLNGRFGFSDRPTITFTPLQGNQFATRLLEPIGLNTILLLIRSGWSPDRVLRLTVQKLNGQDNASRASGPTPAEPADYQSFASASALWRDLSWQDLLELGYQTRRANLSPPVAQSSVHASDLVAAVREGLTFQRDPRKPGNLVVTGPLRTPVLHVADLAHDHSQWKAFAKLLHLDPSAKTLALQTASFAHEPTSLDGANRNRLLITPRSLMGTLFYLSHAIEVPTAHVKANLVTTTVGDHDQPFHWSDVTGNLLHVHTKKQKPLNASVAVFYRGYWFFIADDDLESKSTFSLLGQLFALRAGEIRDSGPQLTLPVGG